MRARTALAMAVVSATTTACVACRPATPLEVDEQAEVEGIRSRLVAADARIVMTRAEDQSAEREILLAFEQAGLPTYRSVGAMRAGDMMLDVRRVRRASSAWSTWNAALSTISLGIIPYTDDGTTTYAIRWSRAGDTVREDLCTEEVPTVFGWVAPFTALREGWHLGGTPDDGTPERSATLARLGLCLARSLDAGLRTDDSERLR